MTILAVEEFVKNILDGLTTSFGPTTVTAYLTPPVPDTITGPMVYVWCDTGDEEQQTMPRSYLGLGQEVNPTGKLITHSVGVSMLAQYDNGNPDTDPVITQGFPSFMNTIRTTLAGTNLAAPLPIPQQLTDPVTAETSWLVAIGHKMRYTQRPVITTADQRLLLFSGVWICDALEQATG